MDQSALVVEQIKSGLELLAAIEESIPIAAAAWVLREGSDEWRLFLASPNLRPGDPENLDSVLVKIIREHPSLWVNRHQVRLVRMDHPVAQDALRLKKRFPDDALIPIGGGAFGGSSVEQAYVYGVAISPHPVS